MTYYWSTTLHCTFTFYLCYRVTSVERSGSVWWRRRHVRLSRVQDLSQLASPVSITCNLKNNTSQAKIWKVISVSYEGNCPSTFPLCTKPCNFNKANIWTHEWSLQSHVKATVHQFFHCVPNPVTLLKPRFESMSRRRCRATWRQLFCPWTISTVYQTL